MIKVVTEDSNSYIHRQRTSLPLSYSPGLGPDIPTLQSHSSQQNYHHLHLIQHRNKATHVTYEPSTSGRDISLTSNNKNLGIYH